MFRIFPRVCRGFVLYLFQQLTRGAISAIVAKSVFYFLCVCFFARLNCIWVEALLERSEVLLCFDVCFLDVCILVVL